MRAKGIEFAILLIWLCRPALGWGDVGHRTVAYVAEHYLTEEGSKLVDELLPHNENFDISDAGTWADEQKQKRPQTEPWHYIDVADDPLQHRCEISSLPPDCANGGCLTSAMESMTSQVNDYRFNQTEALMFLFHFFGDLHVPLHVEGFAQGGNLIKVCFDGHHDNLHSVWDTDMPHKINGIKHHSRHNEEKEASRKWAKRLIQQNQYTPSTAVDVTDPRKWIMQWAEETNRLNCAVVFERGLEYLEKEDLAREYYDDAAPIIEEQIFKAGVRLAIWTNSLAEKRRANMTFVIQGDRSREL